MKSNATQTEILLMTGTRFSARQSNSIAEPGHSNNLTERQKLEEACWNGMLKEMLPELFEQPDGNKNLYLWQIREADAYIELEFGNAPEAKEKYLSIDPYAFMPVQYFS
jgi:hypothetical protein